MRIPLDYYRILGLPTQATSEQVQQAHRDRVLQLPRREYSEPAIAARRELLDEAYSVLSNEVDRQKYDTRFLQQSSGLGGNLGASSGANSGKSSGRESGATTQHPHIIIEDSQLIGALLLLQELGEYELVLKLGEECLAKSKSPKVTATEVDLIAADVALTVALAYLELGREQWQQSHYENAAASLEAGQDLLLREGLFAGVRGEVRSDLYRLRPYRVLELVSQPLDSTGQRQKGIEVLQEMLQERNGIDGHGDDQSGLSVDDFLRFVQQLRDYLTVEEQQNLFEAEARRPSAVASYLAVYALMARGFAEHQPTLAHRAKALLGGLSKRQDVHLEQSVCALMLGQTEEASRALEYSQEFEPLAFIREHSQGSPDLLPGLCLYAERWLQEEVFLNFRDLKGQQATLKAYFADPQVQHYLETLPIETASETWDVPLGAAALPTQLTPAQRAIEFAQGGQNTATTAVSGSYGTSTAILEAPTDPAIARPRRAQGLAAGVAAAGAAGIAAFGSGDRGKNSGGHSGSHSGVAHDNDYGESGAIATETSGASAAPASRRQRRRPDRAGRSSLKLGRILLLAGGTLLALLLLFALLSRVFAWIGSWGKPDLNTAAKTTQVTKLEKDQLAIGLNEPVLADFNALGSVTKVSATGTLDKAKAQQVIQLWLGTKVDVFGKDYKLDLLPNVLTGEALTTWQGEGELSKGDGITVQYEHKLAIDEVTAGESPDKAEVLATVTEIAKYYQNGEVISIRDDRDLQLRYNLLQEDGSWKISSMGVR